MQIDRAKVLFLGTISELCMECCFRQSTASPLAFIEQVIAVANEGFENRSFLSNDLDDLDDLGYLLW